MKPGFKILLVLLVFFFGLIFFLNYSYTKDITIPNHLAGQHITVNNIKLRVSQTGQGPDVLFLHGSIGTLEDFETVIPLLDYYRVTTFDRIGHGYSDMPPVPATIASNADYASALIKTLKLQNVIVVGHSYGGSIALKMAINQDPNLKGLVLLAPASKPAKTRAIEYLFANKYVGMGLLRLLRPVLAENMLRSGLLASLQPNLDSIPDNFTESRLAIWNEPGILYTRTQQTQVVNDELDNMLIKYENISIPSILLIGEKESHSDIYTGTYELANIISKTELVEIKEAGHYLQYKKPAAVVDAINLLNTNN
jgi:pimeloyl-ACP methyl ester carboxylesterase